MTETGFTLKGFFFGEDRGSSAPGILPAIRQALSDGADVSWPVEAEIIADKLGEALEVSFADILARAWGERPEIRNAMEQSLYLPGEALHVPLARHRLTSAHEPSVEIFADGRIVQSLTFGLEVSLQPDDAVLTIRNGRICAVSGGNGRGDGQLELDGSVLIERQSQRLQIAGKVTRGEERRVPGLRNHSAEAA